MSNLSIEKVRQLEPNLFLHFWFTELTEKQHFAKDAARDALIAQRFGIVLDAGS